MTGILLGQTAKGTKVELDLQKLITGRTFLGSVSGGGKSHTARRIIEQMFGQAGIIMVDVEGEYSTLREKYPFLIVGKDVPMVPEAAEYLADQVLGHELSVILDGSDPNLDVAAFQEFLERFFRRFIAIETAAKQPYLIFLEEADELAPEKGTSKSLCLGAMMLLAKKGRKRGLGIVVMTQRTAQTSKAVIAQCTNKLIGRIEWPEDKEVVHRFARIPKDISDKLDTLEQGQFYAAGDFIARPTMVHVGSVQTTHEGATPELTPPAPKELERVVAELSEKLPAIIQGQLAPAIPKVAEIEARLKDKFEGQWQARQKRVEKERDTIKARTEAKYEVRIADLQRKLDEAVRHATMKGGVGDLLSHPLVQKTLEKLNAKQRAFIELLETKGGQDPEHCSLFLETKPDSVKGFVYKINQEIAGLIESQGGRYVSRLAKLFPVTEEAQAEAKESEKLRTRVSELEQLMQQRDLYEKDLANKLAAANNAHESAMHRVKILETTNQRLVDIARGGSIPAETTQETPNTSATSNVSPTSGPPVTVIPVEATLRRTLTKFDIITNTEKLDADESTMTGRILATGLRGFFKYHRRLGEIMEELVRKYSVNKDSGGSKQSVKSSLEELVAKDILDRITEENQWAYFESPEFRERVRLKEVK